jgi:membrane protein
MSREGKGRPALGSARATYAIVKQAVRQFGQGEGMTYAAAVAFYCCLSLAPLLALCLWITSFLGAGAQQAIVDEMVELAGTQTGEAIRSVTEASETSPGGGLAGALAIVMLLVGATGVFAELQAAMNRIWDVTVVPGRGLWRWIRKRLLSLGMIVVIGFLLLVSLMASALLNALSSRTYGGLPGAEWLWLALDTAIPLGAYVLLFAALYKVLPDVRMEWRDVWFGATVTAVLFAAGKLLLGVYVGRAGTGSAYGAAGSLVVLLVWTYYSAALVFFGAELTQAWALGHDRDIAPGRYARAGPNRPKGARSARAE